MEAVVKFIGHIETPYKYIDECPRNIESNGPLCSLVVKEELLDGLLGLSAGQEILILYWFENVDRKRLQQNSRKTAEFSGVFALRTPNRPNPIGAAVVKIEKIENKIIYVKGLDCLNGTPLLDIKPENGGRATGTF
ncbi:MAG: tRNA (N6-threonylcarbamoyladenosine(37)-N6)-methyltransferase TrmO [Desulfobacterales bacterium]|uniref:tRNA (N6-threonylcarbamoyladenosine(37)-N6)-methyltransferase TrmO n=1 Tax=Candidatus Desulfatibia vada TaxID=2841696 RepID=A0A8J6NQF7_9BACT|nr:tRNA (N6-threonylcarbamoyladenosine(37)-N6)-methyltransferase TrmO [Candidatus Desulfatibia vada]MBL6971804.1 tRNA (N6-threonylcarbamoyladenosine(37)-N6)-methyltransferase TrmO [Desulfobacterales bacterium]